MYKTLIIKSIKEEISGFKIFSFERDHDIAYKAGQYLTLVRQIGGEEIRRSYSITSSPQLNEDLAIGVKRMENGLLSRWLTDTLKPGDEIVVTGAGGLFTLPKEMDQYSQFFFFAAGSGITPIFSLIKTVLHLYPQIAIVLVYSNASAEKTVFLDELQQLGNQFAARFQLELLFSNHTDLKKARLNRDLLLDIVNSCCITSFDRTLFYTCGPESYMRLCTYVLQEYGVPKDHIRRENFITHQPSVADPPDKTNHKAFIYYAGKEYEIPVVYPDSILKSAKKQHVSLPYSCEAGQCGNCAAICKKGQVWHSNNEVLTDEDLKKGLVLTCVGHPVGGDVYLEIV